MPNIDNPAYTNTYLVKIRNSETSILITDAKQEITYLAETYLPVQGLKVKVASKSIDMEAEDTTIELPSDVGSADPNGTLARLTDGRPSPLTRVSIYSVVDESSSEVYHADEGHLYQAIKNPKDIQGLSRFLVRDESAYFDKPAGISCNLQCFRVFGDSGCTFVPGEEFITVLAVGLNTVQISRSYVTSDKFYHRGKIEYRGLKLTIKEWTSGDTITTVQSVPPAMEGALVKLIQGCDKSEERCTEYSNTINFLGLGKHMVPYSPLSEAP